MHAPLSPAPTVQPNWHHIVTGDCRSILQSMAPNTINCCVTSPPYFGLRDYGTASWSGGDPNCDHLGEPVRTSANINRNYGAGFNDVKNAERRQPMGPICSKCNATRTDSQIGLEQTPQEYIAQLVAVFREVHRVLRDDGTLWLNLGDSYARTGGTDRKISPTALVGSTLNTVEQRGDRTQAAPLGLKDKDLIGIPWRVALALQADGWYLRQDIIWHKPNPMPESVRDRCTKAHEYIFLLSKLEKYYFDSDAIAEDSVKGASGSKFNRGKTGEHQLSRSSNADRVETGKRNRRSVWTVSTKPFKEAHFATFPPDLIEPCILAGCPVNGIVLDPFGGAGTTALVAKRNNRNALLMELNPAYVAIAEQRLAPPT